MGAVAAQLRFSTTATTAAAASASGAVTAATAAAGQVRRARREDAAPGRHTLWLSLLPAGAAAQQGQGQGGKAAAAGGAGAATGSSSAAASGAGLAVSADGQWVVCASPAAADGSGGSRPGLRLLWLGILRSKQQGRRRDATEEAADAAGDGSGDDDEEAEGSNSASGSAGGVHDFDPVAVPLPDALAATVAVPLPDALAATVAGGVAPSQLHWAPLLPPAASSSSSSSAGGIAPWLLVAVVRGVLHVALCATSALLQSPEAAAAAAARLRDAAAAVTAAASAAAAAGGKRKRSAAPAPSSAASCQWSTSPAAAYLYELPVPRGSFSALPAHLSGLPALRSVSAAAPAVANQEKKQLLAPIPKATGAGGSGSSGMAVKRSAIALLPWPRSARGGEDWRGLEEEEEGRQFMTMAAMVAMQEEENEGRTTATRRLAQRLEGERREHLLLLHLLRMRRTLPPRIGGHAGTCDSVSGSRLSRSPPTLRLCL
jgi:hypothetical protein